MHMYVLHSLLKMHEGCSGLESIGMEWTGLDYMVKICSINGKCVQSGLLM